MLKQSLFALSLSLIATPSLGAVLLKEYTIDIPDISVAAEQSVSESLLIPRYSGSNVDLSEMLVRFDGTTKSTVIVTGEDPQYPDYNAQEVSVLTIVFSPSDNQVRGEAVSNTESGILYPEESAELNFEGVISGNNSFNDQLTLTSYSGGGNQLASLTYDHEIARTLSIGSSIEGTGQFENGVLYVEYYGKVPEPTTLLGSIFLGFPLVLKKINSKRA